MGCERAAARRRVAVTGLGIVSPVGNDVSTAWRNVLAGRSGIGRIEAFDASAFAARIAGAVRGLDVDAHLPRKAARRMPRFMQLGVIAARQAIADAWPFGDCPAARVGIVMGSMTGGSVPIEGNCRSYQQGGPRRISPLFGADGINMTAGHIAMEHGIRGPCLGLAGAGASSAQALGLAARLIAWGDADAMIAGGAECTLGPLVHGGLCATAMLSRRHDEPERASRPWDRERDGFVPSEGGAALVLEELTSARARGAPIYAELAGCGMATACMSGALRDAGLDPGEIDYINAHAASTLAGDLAEARAIRRVFGRSPAVSSTKSTTGHLLGAAGAAEAIFTVLALRDQVAPPTINLDSPDPDCELDHVRGEARSMLIRAALSNAFGIGGARTSLAFRVVS